MEKLPVRDKRSLNKLEKNQNRLEKIKKRLPEAKGELEDLTPLLPICTDNFKEKETQYLALKDEKTKIEFDKAKNRMKKLETNKSELNKEIDALKNELENVEREIFLINGNVELEYFIALNLWLWNTRSEMNKKGKIDNLDNLKKAKREIRALNTANHFSGLIERRFDNQGYLYK